MATDVVTMTAKELKNRTGTAMRALERGQRMVLTRRGRTVGVMVPAGDAAARTDPDYEEAWADIEQALARTKPEFASWREALGRSRRRT